jgi:hypothetical protein
VDPLAELVAWRIGGFKFGLTTVGAVIVFVIVVAFLIYLLVRARRGLSK